MAHLMGAVNDNWTGEFQDWTLYSSACRCSSDIQAKVSDRGPFVTYIQKTSTADRNMIDGCSLSASRNLIANVANFLLKRCTVLMAEALKNAEIYKPFTVVVAITRPMSCSGKMLLTFAMSTLKNPS